jgi:hypothetical protein
MCITEPNIKKREYAVRPTNYVPFSNVKYAELLRENERACLVIICKHPFFLCPIDDRTSKIWNPTRWFLGLSGLTIATNMSRSYVFKSSCSDVTVGMIGDRVATYSCKTI